MSQKLLYFALIILQSSIGANHIKTSALNPLITIMITVSVATVTQKLFFVKMFLPHVRLYFVLFFHPFVLGKFYGYD